MDELFFRKTKTGWECSDRQGRKGQGLTKEMAKHNYYMKYEFEQPSVDLDMSKYMNKIGD